MALPLFLVTRQDSGLRLRTAPFEPSGWMPRIVC